MREFNNSECTSDYIRNIKKQKKGIANNPKILEEYNKVIEDTKIAIENLTEYINNHELLNGLLLKIQQEDSSFLVGALGLTKRGNNSSYYINCMTHTLPYLCIHSPLIRLQSLFGHTHNIRDLKFLGSTGGGANPSVNITKPS